MRFRIIGIICLAMAAVSSASCTKAARESAYASQENLIEKFVDSYSEARVTYTDHSTRVTITEGDGVELNARGKVSIYYAGYNFTSGSISKSTLFVTNSKDVASSASWNLSEGASFEPVEIDMTDDEILDGLRQGLEGVREGEECYILFTGKYAFGKSKVGVVPANSPLAFHVWVESIQN